jgi:hypothetical protein
VKLKLRRLPILVAVLVLPLGLTACHKKSHPHNGDTEAIYVDAGPLTYQVQLSRQLNQYNVEDRQYLHGLPAGTTPLNRNQLWFAVFVWARNQTGRVVASSGPEQFDIVDTQFHYYYAIPLNPALNAVAWTSQYVAPRGTEPGPDTLASLDGAQGGELLFKLTNSVYSNRPITLEIRGPSGLVEATVSLDL